MHDRSPSHWWLPLPLLALAGCYTGLEGSFGDPTGASGGSEGSGADPSDDDADDGIDGEPADECHAPAPRLWKLTPVQLARTIDAVLPGAPVIDPRVADTLPGGKFFSNETGLLEANQPHVEALVALATTLADYAITQPSLVHPCLDAGFDDSTCMADGVQQFGARAFRRPLGPDEVEAFIDLYEATRASDTAQIAVWQVLRAIFLSPRFLYRSELGTADSSPDATFVDLDPYERASALSYFITDGPPDESLVAAAAADALSDPEQLEAHARRLLADPAAAEGVIQFLSEQFGEQFGGPRLAGVTKDPELYPQFDDALLDAMAAEPRAFYAHALASDDPSYTTLLTADYTVADERVAALYGVQGPELGAARIELPAGRRSGVLTQPGLLAALARPDEGDIVRRGLFVREQLLCEHLPAPPDDANAVPPPPEPGRTHRERMEIHSEQPACATCHDLIDPLGFAFEHYDALGQWRDLDAGKPVDASGTVELDGQTHAFDDAVQLGELLARSQDARACFVRHAVEYAQGRRATAASACDVQATFEVFEDFDGDLAELVVALVLHPSFLQRQR